VQHVRLEGHPLALTNLEKVLYPAAGFTKAEVIDYYVRVAPVLLPHLGGRPLNLKRYPDGVEAPFFFQKECPANHPDWLPTTRVESGSGGGAINYCMADDTAGLVWLVNAGNLEMHTFLATATDVERPTVVAFDLDPGPGAGLVQCCEVALWVKEWLGAAGVACYPKVSGGKGMQVYAPLNTPVTYEATRTMALAVALAIEREHPKAVTSNMRKDRRTGRVLVDYSQNSRHKSTVSAYSLRGQPTPTVSAPLLWSEVEDGAAGEAQHLRFTPDDVLERVRRNGDLFAEVLTRRQRLPAFGA